jgi:hypothetical protein
MDTITAVVWIPSWSVGGDAMFASTSRSRHSSPASGVMVIVLMFLVLRRPHRTRR